MPSPPPPPPVMDDLSSYPIALLLCRPIPHATVVPVANCPPTSFACNSGSDFVHTLHRRVPRARRLPVLYSTSDTRTDRRHTLIWIVLPYVRRVVALVRRACSSVRVCVYKVRNGTSNVCKTSRGTEKPLGFRVVGVVGRTSTRGKGSLKMKHCRAVVRSTCFGSTEASGARNSAANASVNSDYLQPSIYPQSKLSTN